ncbi:MAG: hypothetical protein RL685_4661, partial [Pseudomonadota bacterium]
MTENGPRVPLIPDNAPFDEEQRAWLNGFLAGVLGLAASEPKASSAEAVLAAPARPRSEPPPPLRPEPDAQERRLLGVLAHLDCGQCGYSCQGYAHALTVGAEQDLSLCLPGGPATREALERLLSAPLRNLRLPRAPSELPGGLSLGGLAEESE